MLKKKLCLSAVVSFLCAVFLFIVIHNNESYAKVKGIISVGTAKAKITPETPVPLSGYGSRKEPFKGVHDDVFVRTMVFSDGSTQAALIVADLIGFSSTFQNSVTKRIEKEIQITPPCDCLCCYDIDSVITNVERGIYLVQVWNADQTEMFGEVDVIVE